MSKYLRLDCPYWFVGRFDEPCFADELNSGLRTGKYMKIEPVFHRTGWYYNRQTKTSWVEHNGEAYRELDATMFLHTLKVAHHIPLSLEGRELIRQVAKHTKVGRQALQSLLYWDDHWHHLRAIRRGYPR